MLSRWGMRPTAVEGGRAASLLERGDVPEDWTIGLFEENRFIAYMTDSLLNLGNSRNLGFQY